MNKLIKVILVIFMLNMYVFNVFANVSTESDLYYEIVDEYNYEDLIYPTLIEDNNFSFFGINDLSTTGVQDALKSYIYNYLYKMFGFNMADNNFFNETNAYYQNALYYLSASIFNIDKYIDWTTIYNNYLNTGVLELSENDVLSVYHNLVDVFGPYVFDNDNKFEFFLDGTYDIPMELSKVNIDVKQNTHSIGGYTTISNHFPNNKTYKYRVINGPNNFSSSYYNVQYQPYYILDYSNIQIDSFSCHLNSYNQKCIINPFENVSYLNGYVEFLPTKVNTTLNNSYYFPNRNEFYMYSGHSNSSNTFPGVAVPYLNKQSNGNISSQFVNNAVVLLKGDSSIELEYHIEVLNDTKEQILYDNFISDYTYRLDNGKQNTSYMLVNKDGEIYDGTGSLDTFIVYTNSPSAEKSSVQVTTNNIYLEPLYDETTDRYFYGYPLAYESSSKYVPYDIFYGRNYSEDIVNYYNFEIEPFNQYGTSLLSMSDDELLDFYEIDDSLTIDVDLFDESIYEFDNNNNVLSNKTSSELSGVSQEKFNLIDVGGSNDDSNNDDDSGTGEMEPALAFLKGIGDAIKDGLGNVGDTLKNGYEAVKDTVTNVADNIKDLPNNLWNSVKEGYTWIKDGLSNIGQTISNLPSTLWNLIKDGFSWITEQLSNIWQAITDLPNTIWELIQDGYNWIKEAIESVTTALGNLAIWLWDKFKLGFEWIADGLENIWNAILSIPQAIWEFFKTGFSWISEKLGQIWEAITNIATQFIDTIVSAFSILFIPNDGFFENKIEELKALLEQKIPLSLFTGYYDALFNTPVYYSNKVPNDITMTMPMALGGMTLTVLSFEWFAPYHNTFIQFQTFTIWLLFGMAMLTKVRKLVANK